MTFKLGFDYMEEAGTPSGGAPAAAPAPTQEAPAPSTPPAADPPAVNWDEMIDLKPADDSLPDADDLPPGAPDGEQPPGPLKAVTQPEAPQPPQQPAAPAQPPAQQPTAPQKTQEQLAQEAQAHRDGMLKTWSGIYENELTEEDKSALIAAPETVMPKLMAKAALDAVEFARREFQAALPQIIAQHLNQSQHVSGVWKQFTDANTDLAKPEYRQVIAQAAQTVKATQPNLPADKAMAVVAATARALLGLPAPGTAPASQDPPSPPVAPHNPVARGRASPRAPAPAAKKDAPNSGEIDWGDLAGAP